MSTPPSPGWQPQQPGQPPHNAPPYGSQPGSFPPGGYPQGGWPQQQPPKGGNTTKLLLVAIAVLLVIGVTIGATLLLTQGTGDATTDPSVTQNVSGFASASDTGPISVITSEPTCQTYTGINDAIAAVESKGWGTERDRLGPVSTWTTAQRSSVGSVATAMHNAASQVLELAKETPHRVVRELYLQFSAYGRAYEESIENYVPSDNFLASTNVNAGRALMSICEAISNGATGRAISVAAAPAPSVKSDAKQADSSTMFLAETSDVCQEWVDRDDKFNSETAEWQASPTDTAAEIWTSERRALQLATVPKLVAYANDLQALGQKSGNAPFEDFAIAGAQYLRAYIAASDTYVPSDSFLAATAFRFGNTITSACRVTLGG